MKKRKLFEPWELLLVGVLICVVVLSQIFPMWDVKRSYYVSVKQDYESYTISYSGEYVYEGYNIYEGDDYTYGTCVFQSGKTHKVIKLIERNKEKFDTEIVNEYGVLVNNVVPDNCIYICHGRLHYVITDPDIINEILGELHYLTSCAESSKSRS